MAVDTEFEIEAGIRKLPRYYAEREGRYRWSIWDRWRDAIVGISYGVAEPSRTVSLLNKFGYVEDLN